MADSPRNTQNENRGEIGGNAMKSTNSRLVVSDMVKKFTPNSTPTGNRTTPVVRQGPQVATFGSPASSRTPPTTPKPVGPPSRSNGPRRSTAPKPFQSENKPIVSKEKMDFESRKAKQEENRRPPWDQQREEPEKKKHEAVQPWNPRHKQQDKAEELRSTCAQEEEEANLPSWKIELMRAKQKTEKTSENSFRAKSHEDSISARYLEKPKPDDQISSSNGPRWGSKPPRHPIARTNPPTVPWNKTHSDEFPAAPDAEKPSDNLTPKRSTEQSKSFTVSTDTSPQKRANSFLHTGLKLPEPKRNAASGPLLPPSGEKPQKPNGVPRRLRIPEEKYYESPPRKASKPPNVVLPSKGKKKFSLPSLPGSMFSLPSLDLPVPPPSSGRGLTAPPSANARDRPPRPRGARDLHAPPPTGARDLPLPLPIGARDLPLPSPIGARDPHSPKLPPLPSIPTDFVPPDLPSRPLPSPCLGNVSMLSPAPLIEEDIYDDAGEEPPPLPQIASPPMVKKVSSDLIPTWSDEEEEAVYDETSDELPPPARPLIPSGFPMPGAPPQIPEEEEEMYEEVEEYMRLKKLRTQQEQQPRNGSVPGGKDKKKKDKKKKDLDKREKDIRQKFKLPAEGDIEPQGKGIVKETCKGSGKNLGVTKAERIEIIRMTNNPKGKWLIRNTQGEYGYIESEKVSIDVNELRHTFGVAGMVPSGIGGGPPVPTGIIPTTGPEDDEAIYDETADEDIYEEV